MRLSVAYERRKGRSGEPSKKVVSLDDGGLREAGGGGSEEGWNSGCTMRESHTHQGLWMD